jgi:nucleoside-diphosphate-sugar epimerase
MERPRILVFGATGDIGSTLLKNLAKAGDVRAFTRKEVESSQPIPNVEWIKGDLYDPQSLARATRGMDIVFNTIGSMTAKHVDVYAYQTNVPGLLKIVNACRKQDVRRFVHLSSVAVYGKQDQEVEKGEEPITEDSPLNARSAYGVSKILGEKLIRENAEETEWTVIRPANLIGAEMDVFSGHFLRRIRAGSRVPFFKGGDATFNYINVHNLVDLMVTAANTPQAKNQVFNGVDGVSTWRDVLTRHGEAVGLETKGYPIPQALVKSILSSPVTEFVGDRLNVAIELANSVVSGRVYSANKAREVLDWSPKVNLDETMTNITQQLLVL